MGEGGWTVRGTKRWVKWNGAELDTRDLHPSALPCSFYMDIRYVNEGECG
jgi:hypothetical protein